MKERATVWALRGIGLLFLLLGVGALAIAPLEMICFRWFAEGGRFGYEGFGYGSFMAGNLAMQILGYYVIAAIAIPLGMGHLGLRAWVRPVMLALLQVWWVLGVPLLGVILFVLFASKEVSLLGALAAAITAVAAYTVLPIVLRRFYRGPALAPVLCSTPAGILHEPFAAPVWAVVALEVSLALALQVLVFFGGLFPLITGWATGLPALALLDAAILILLVLVWGTLHRHRWAWWGALALVAALLVLWTATLAHTSWLDLVDVLAFPLAERRFLSGIPLQGPHLALLVALPLAGSLLLVLRARSAFVAPPPAAREEQPAIRDA